MSEHNFVRMGRTIYAFGSLDEVNRIFIGYRLTKEIITDLLDGKLEDIDESNNKTTILFREHGSEDIYIHEATLDDIEELYYIYKPYSYYSEDKYNQALDDIARFETVRFFKDMRIDISHAKLIVERYNTTEIEMGEYKIKIAEREAWLLRVKEQWFS